MISLVKTRQVKTSLQALATPDHGNLEANLPELVGVNDETAIKDERRLRHLVVNRLPVDLLELLPLRRDHDRLLLLARLQCRGSNADLLFDFAGERSTNVPEMTYRRHTLLKREIGASFRHILPNLGFLDLGIIDGNIRPLSEEIADQGDCGRFTRVAGVSLECET